ncbi:ABC transporter permease [Candidatus Poribacteria bacterium]|nr:ABC transporter permease [Candidatus Poribacteria bacterium]
MAAVSRGHALRNYVVRRLLMMIPTFLGVTLLTFVVCQFVPGGPIDQLRLRLAGGAAGEAGGSSSRAPQGIEQLPAEQLKALEAYYGFDKPIPVRYLNWLKNILKLDLGQSYRYTKPVIELIVDRLPVSLYYGVITTVLTYFVCIPLGIVKAIKHRTPFDNATSLVIFIGYAIPGYALGAVMLVIFAVKLDWFPLGEFYGEGFADLNLWGKIKDVAYHSVLPLISYMVTHFAVMTMLMKNSLMENMGADYVKTALAKGLPWPKAVLGHAVRNSLIPLATSFGNNISIILTGSVLIERVFNIQGVGLLTFTAITQRDYPVVLGMTVIGSALVLVGNLLSDLCVAFVDPRVRFE